MQRELATLGEHIDDANEAARAQVALPTLSVISVHSNCNYNYDSLLT